MKCLVATAWILVVGINLPAADLQVAPDKVELRDAFARRQLLVSIDGKDATRRARYISRQPAIASVDAAGYVVPIANGVAEIEITLADQTVVVPVDVRGLDQVRPVDFATEIQPLLSRFGCNSGGCHGKASGQNGFKLSLFGFDTVFDYAALVKKPAAAACSPRHRSGVCYWRKRPGRFLTAAASASSPGASRTV